MVTGIEKQLDSPLGPRDAGLLMELDEFEKADFEEGYRYELIHGVLVVSPSPREEERGPNDELGYWLRSYRDSHPSGSALDDTLPELTVRTRASQRRCDRAIWAGLARPPRTRGPVKSRDVPTIIIEFPSRRPDDRRRDYEEKEIEYNALGVREYWIIDPFRRQMTVHARVGSVWKKRVLSEKETYRTEVLPGFELSLEKLFEVADRYAGE